MAGDPERVTDGTGEARPASWESWLTVPNVITVARLVLVAPIVVLLARGEYTPWLIGLLLAFALSDWVDGVLARRLGQVSRVGTVLDPIADRVGVAAVVLGLIVAGRLPLGVGIAIVVVDVVVGISVLVRRPSEPPTVSVVGKVRTALLLAGLVGVGLGLLPGFDLIGRVGALLTILGAVLHVVAGMGYVRAVFTAPRRGDVGSSPALLRGRPRPGRR